MTTCYSTPTIRARQNVFELFGAPARSHGRGNTRGPRDAGADSRSPRRHRAVRRAPEGAGAPRKSVVNLPQLPDGGTIRALGRRDGGAMRHWGLGPTPGRRLPLAGLLPDGAAA
ncbi:hypothetical protein Ato02nite_049050 [Paractinoplanes toevensis]|uniref:Uncharacterized protein n=1 Tax=Paractinoplanes toevensis TaxID=571911 RepID=A0A919TD41_9ACTN|nr:hypothetical protein Ato02nite_049050 [Actinoplanes toevensis]